MANSLPVTVGGRKLRFDDDFTVHELDAAGVSTRNTPWASVSEEKKNALTYQFPGEAKRSLAVEYSFNDRNQLTIEIPKQDTVEQASSAWTFNGKIFVDDTSDVVYALLDETGKLSPRKITVYATLSLAKDYSKLVVTFSDKTETAILGIGDATENLNTEEYAAGGDLARDLLAFKAVTVNSVGGNDRDMDAEISFFGRWDMHQNALVFVTHYDNTGTKPTGYVALGGEIKGTNFGLIVAQDGSAVLQIKGRYEWNKNTLSWDFAAGYSKAAGLEAKLSAKAKVTFADGTLAIAGDATLAKGPQGTKLTVNLALDYEVKDRKITFSLKSDGNSYEVKLSGNIKVRDFNVEFELTASDKDGKKNLVGTLKLGVAQPNSNLKLALEATLTKSGLKLVATMEFRFFWGPNGPVAELPA